MFKFILSRVALVVARFSVWSTLGPKLVALRHEVGVSRSTNAGRSFGVDSGRVGQITEDSKYSKYLFLAEHDGGHGVQVGGTNGYNRNN